MEDAAASLADPRSHLGKGTSENLPEDSAEPECNAASVKGHAGDHGVPVVAYRGPAPLRCADVVHQVHQHEQDEEDKVPHRQGARRDAPMALEKEEAGDLREVEDRRENRLAWQRDPC